MPDLKTALGAVFEIESNPYAMRVIAFDDAEVMYDVWWPHKEAWGMARLLGGVTCYRLRRDYVEANARYIRTDPLSEAELRVHRPELPFAVAQRKEISWYEPSGREGVLETAPVSEYPLVFVARDKRLFEVELPSFMYQSGTIGAIKATIDYWPIFQLGGTTLRVR